MIKYLEKEEDFAELTKNRCLVDFYADWCGPCRMLGEVIENLSSERNNIDVIKVNTDKFGELSRKMGIMSIPALFIMEDGKEVRKNVGYMTLDELKKFIEN